MAVQWTKTCGHQLMANWNGGKCCAACGHTE